MVAVQTGDRAQDHAVDAGAEHLCLDLLGDLLGAAEDDVLFEVVRNQVRCGVLGAVGELGICSPSLMVTLLRNHN